MKLIVLYLGRHGAGPMYSYEFCKALLKQIIKLLVILSSYCDNLSNWIQLEKEYANHLNLVIIPTYNSKREFILSSLNILRFYRIVKLINEFGSKHIFAPMVHPWHNIILSFISPQIQKIKVIHDASVHSGERNLFSLLLNWIDINISDKLVVLSNYSKIQLEEKVNKNKPIIVIPHAEFGGYNQFSENKSPKIIFNKIGFFGRINKYKGLNVLLEALPEIHQHLPHLELLIAGNGDCTEYEDYFNKYKSILELHIRWIEDEEVANLLKGIDLVVLPYIEASQSGVIPLAFALGKTVIATNVGGLPEQVPINTGYIIPPNCPEILADTIIDLYKNPDKIIEMGQNAHEYAKENLSWESSANKLLENL